MIVILKIKITIMMLENIHLALSNHPIKKHVIYVENRGNKLSLFSKKKIYNHPWLLMARDNTGISYMYVS